MRPVTLWDHTGQIYDRIRDRQMWSGVTTLDQALRALANREGVDISDIDPQPTDAADGGGGPGAPAPAAGKEAG